MLFGFNRPNETAVTLTTSKDIVIPIMGRTGAGKSTFINTLLGQPTVKVGRDLVSCTAELEAIVIDPIPSYSESLRGHRLVIVDTPGFDDTFEDDLVILERISKWLKDSYLKENILGGVIYLHDISANRFSGAMRKNLDMFHHLCGDKALSKAILGTTHWKKDPQANCDADRYEAQMKEKHWKSLIDKGANVLRFHNSRESAWYFIDIILGFVLNEKLKEVVLLIQKELTHQRKLFRETGVGREMRETLEKALETQKKLAKFSKMAAMEGDEEAKAQLKEGKEKIAKLLKQMEALKVPIWRRLYRIFIVPTAIENSDPENGFGSVGINS